MPARHSLSAPRSQWISSAGGHPIKRQRPVPSQCTVQRAPSLQETSQSASPWQKSSHSAPPSHRTSHEVPGAHVMRAVAPAPTIQLHAAMQTRSHAQLPMHATVGPHGVSQRSVQQPDEHESHSLAHMQSVPQLVPLSPGLQHPSPHSGMQSASHEHAVSPGQQRPSPHIDAPQSAAHEHGSSPPAAQHAPSPQVAPSQSASHEHWSSLPLQIESPHAAAQSGAQLAASSPAQQAPSPQLDPQSAAHEHGDSPPSQIPSPHPAASPLASRAASNGRASNAPASRGGLGPTSRPACMPPRSSVHAESSARARVNVRRTREA